MMRMNLQLFATNRILDLLKDNGVKATTNAGVGVSAILNSTKKSNGTNTGTSTASNSTKNATTSGAKALTGVNALAGGAKASAGLNAISSGAKGVGVSAVGNTVKSNSESEQQQYTPSAITSTVGEIGQYSTSAFNQSDRVTNAQREAELQLDYLKNLGSASDVIDQETWDALNKKWVQPQAVTDAWNYTNGLLEQLTSGRTSYTDQIKGLMGQIQNREKFSYDVDSDVLFQQYLASSMASGKTAMQDTMGQASALTGGYGSTYATSAANQQYNAYIQDAYNNLPEYYQMAMEAYQMEGDEMYKQFSMLSEADNTEYQRMYNAWESSFNNATNMYERAYGEWADGVNNAYNSANLQLSEHRQIFDQAYNTYNAMQDNANTLYSQEYQKWADEVNNALNIAKMESSNYWNSMELAQRQAEHAAEMEYKNRALTNEQNQFNAKMIAEQKEAQAKKDEEASKLTSPSKVQMDDALTIRNTQGEEAYYDYLEELKTMGVDTQPIKMSVEANRDVSWIESIGADIKDTWNNLWR